MKRYDLAIMGGGVMGLMTAYYAIQDGQSVLLVDRAKIGNAWAASSGLTRSFRSDYLDPLYARLALAAREYWMSLEGQAQQQFLLPTGCLNLAANAVVRHQEKSYAVRAEQVLANAGGLTQTFSSKDLTKSYPQFKADLATLDTGGGILLASRISSWLLNELQAGGVQLQQNTQLMAIKENRDAVTLTTDQGCWQASAVAITAGRAVNSVIGAVDGNTTVYPISTVRPQENKYFRLPRRLQKRYSADQLPVFACLDVGIYGHPWVIGETRGLKIGYFRPTDSVTSNEVIDSVADFVTMFMPELAELESEVVLDTDRGEYCLVDDDDFIVGFQPGFKRILVATGWRGTGYKFAPLVGSRLANAARTGKIELGTDRFNPERFVRNG